MQAVEPSGDPRSEAVHALFAELLTEAERAGHKPAQRLVFLACTARLVPRMRLYCVRHLARLMPLLLEWLLAYDAPSRAAALRCAELLLRAAWPRMGAHGALLWRHLLAAAARRDGGVWRPRGGDEDGGAEQAAAEEDERAAMEAVAALLVAICGKAALLGAAPGGEPAAAGGSAPGPMQASLLALL